MDDKERKRIENVSRIIEVAVELGIKVKGNVGKCFMAERHGNGNDMTLFFNVAKNTFLCKTCPDVGGSVTDLVCQQRGWEERQALDWLAHRAEFDQLTKSMYHGKGRKK
ncbi:MAG: hypothetical protein V1792_06180 [Pseudomonadota bacterium]